MRTKTLAVTLLCLSLSAGCKEELPPTAGDRAPANGAVGTGRTIAWPGAIPSLGARPSSPADPAAAFRGGPIDPHVRTVPSSIRQGLRADPMRQLPALVRHLVAGSSNEYHKARRIHDWVADNIQYDVAAYRSGSLTRAADPGSVLATGRAVCSGYSAVFEQMGKLAGLEVATIPGYARGYSFSLWDGREDRSPPKGNHAWSAVRISGRWYLLDTTWDAGSVGDDGFQKNYRTDFLFMEPHAFLHTHWPKDPAWQLQTPSADWQQFAALPYLRGEFFGAGLRPATPLRRINRASQSTVVRLFAPPGARLMATLRDSSGQEHDGRTFVQSGDGVVDVFVLFPSAGEYTVSLFSRSADASAEAYALSGMLGFDASAGSEHYFPELYAPFSDLRASVKSPFVGPLPVGTPVRYDVRVPGAAKVAVVTSDDRWTHLTPGADGAFSGDVTSPGGSAALYALLDAGGREWAGLLKL